MIELIENDKIKMIAFYLPQFHSIPENDRAHGERFTEWTNTKKARPLYDGHYQPRAPLNGEYYNLLDDGVMENQSKLAKSYGIDAFCYYHYWFKDGKKLLEKPIESMLKNPKIDMPFCLCWANENWTKRWDGGNNEIIMEQDYGDINDWEKHFQYLLNFFKDSRYVAINGKPVFIIYKPELIPNLKKLVSYLRKRIKENGFQDIYILCQYPKYYLDGEKRNILDGYIEFEPKFTQDYNVELNKNKIKKMLKRILYILNMRKFVLKIQKKNELRLQYTDKKLIIRDYDTDWQALLNRTVNNKKMIAGAFVDWDNTPRNSNGLSYRGSNPEKFQKYLCLLIKKVKIEYKLNIIFINAWNEWAEGAYLEPDEKYGYSYLEAVKRSFEEEH